MLSGWWCSRSFISSVAVLGVRRMATEPHSTKHEPPPGAVEMPEPTVAPLVLSLGMAMFAAGIIMGPVFLVIGGIVLFYGLGMWISNLLPGRGHMHEALVAP